ncbi:MAG: carboxypeptidase-like regulatory domain-containing protein [Planctomycetia bacterium]|nr:carboxypeptidase-like regulatory domain-containing protein [Planctomycetia bacterium]
MIKFNKLSVRVLVPTLLFVFLMAGCQNKETPDGFPTLVPCSISVTKSGAPMEGVSVSLVAAHSGRALSMVGQTDATGKAKLVTTQGSYMANGVPQGNYKVVVRKNIPLGLKNKTSDEMAAMTLQERQAFAKEEKVARDRNHAEMVKLVPLILWEPSSTPLTFDVPASGGSLSIELADYAK